MHRDTRIVFRWCCRAIGVGSIALALQSTACSRLVPPRPGAIVRMGGDCLVALALMAYLS